MAARGVFKRYPVLSSRSVMHGKNQKSLQERLVNSLVIMGRADIVLSPEARDIDKVPSRRGSVGCKCGRRKRQVKVCPH